jgi:diguanylate cyclase (GGDEF)-like protein
MLGRKHMFDIFGYGKSKDNVRALEVLNMQLAEAKNELERIGAGLAALSKIVVSTSSRMDSGNVCKYFLDMFIELTRARIGTVLLEESGYLTVKEFRNIDGAALRGIRIPSAAGFVNIFKEKKMPCTMEDLCNTPDFHEDDVFTGVRFYLDPDILVPLVYKNEFLGIVTLGDFPVKVRKPGDITLLQVLAAQMSFAFIDERFSREREGFNKEKDLLSKQLSDAQEKKGAFLQRLNKASASLSLLDAEKLKALTLNLVFETVDVDNAVFFLRSEDEISLISVSLAVVPGVVTKKIYFEIDNDFIEKLRLDKKPLFIESSRVKEILESQKCSPETSAALAEAGMTLFVPFISNERVLALLVLGPKRSGGEFSELEMELLNTMSFQFAAAIDNAKLFEAGVLDGLTKAYTRRFFEHRLEYEIAVGMHYRTRRILSLIMVDLDHFKQVNDTYGHQVGDQVLSEFAGIITGVVRMTDTVARYGGEEFVVILPEFDLENGARIAEKMRAAVASFVFLPQGPALRITASFGISSYPDFARTKDDLVSKADKALYKSKESGRNRVTLCSSV